MQGGGVSSKQVKLGDTYGDLPLPSRPGYSFNGWYEEALVTSESVLSTPCDKTLVAEWNDGIPIDMRNWSLPSNGSGTPFSTCFSNWNVQNGKNSFDVKGIEGSEVLYVPLSLTKDKTYSIKFNYIMPDITEKAGELQVLPVYITPDLPGRLDILKFTVDLSEWAASNGYRGVLDEVMAFDMLKPNESGDSIISFTVRDTKEYYFAIHFGQLGDEETFHYEFSNFTLYTHQCSFG